MKVIQTWDDGIVSDIRLIEIFRRYQAKATFCLNPGLYLENRSFGWTRGNREIWRLSTHELVNVYNGFEICSHSMTHPCLIDLPFEKLQWEIQNSKDVLETQFNKPVQGFCYPFNSYNDFIKRAVCSAGYKWARGNQHQDDIFPPVDPYEFPPTCHLLDIDFWEKYNRQKKKNRVFFFWGHSYELVDDVMWENLEIMISRISSDPQTEWSFVIDLFV